MKSNTLTLYWQSYKMFPYEKTLGLREAQALLLPSGMEEQKDKLLVSDTRLEANASRLVYFSHVQSDRTVSEVTQHRIEQNGKKGTPGKRQNTRYASHGLHEYKGKFNPQVVKALFNIFGLQQHDQVLDPFCGSGTSLVEAAIGGLRATGTDINPLAVFIANAKITALTIEWESLQKSVQELLDQLERGGNQPPDASDAERRAYLESWFPPDTLQQIEAAKSVAEHLPPAHRPILLTLVSNVLRDYSHQEPSDLRIRRRKSPWPEATFLKALRISMESTVRSLRAFQMTEGLIVPEALAHCADIRQPNSFLPQDAFDFAVTSPPYATALPYIDTQRLSLVWLDLVPAHEIRALEGTLIGSREFGTKGKQGGWQDLLLNNQFALPGEVASFCQQLYQRLDADDGFRKKALPQLLYRYFYDMRRMFAKVQQSLKPGAHFALIVGHNHTTIGGVRTDIDTPAMLGPVGASEGLKLAESMPLEAYQRYGLHMNNAVQKESLLIFQKP